MDHQFAVFYLVIIVKIGLVVVSVFRIDGVVFLPFYYVYAVCEKGLDSVVESFPVAIVVD